MNTKFTADSGLIVRGIAQSYLEDIARKESSKKVYNAAEFLEELQELKKEK